MTVKFDFDGVVPSQDELDNWNGAGDGITIEEYLVVMIEGGDFFGGITSGEGLEFVSVDMGTVQSESKYIKMDNPLLKQVRVDKMRDYLLFKGWDSKDDGAVFLLFYGPNDASGERLDIAIPMKATKALYYSYLAKAINLLAAIDKKTSKEIIDEIVGGVPFPNNLGLTI